MHAVDCPGADQPLENPSFDICESMQNRPHHDASKNPFFPPTPTDQPSQPQKQGRRLGYCCLINNTCFFFNF